MRVNAVGPNRVKTRAPASAPAALRRPNVRQTCQSIFLRSRQQRRAVATACGIVTAATAALVP
jgi:hypothetical protein